MEIVDLRKKDGGVSPKYLNVPQPMYVFHSKKELREYIIEKKLKTFHIIKDLNDFLEFTKTYNLQGKNKYAQVSNINVFVATGEQFIPGKTDSKGTIYWKLDEEGQAIPTDNCYIQLHLLFSARNHYLCFFSNGVEMLSLSKWHLTAAIKDQFQRPLNPQHQPGGRGTYDSRLKELLQREKVTVRDVRLFHLLFNPISDVKFDVDSAVKRIWGGAIRQEDREKLVQTERFRKLFKKELGYLMGDLKKAFQTEIPDKEMVQMAKTIFEKSIDKGTVDDSLNVYNAILNIRESEEDIPATGVRLLDGKEDPKRIDGKKKEKGFILPTTEAVPDLGIEEYDEVEGVNQPPEKVTHEVTDFTMIKPTLSPEEQAKKKKELESLRDETDAIDFAGLSDLSKLDDL